MTGRRRAPAWSPAISLALAAILTACAPAASPAPGGSPAGSDLSGEITVYAAASLRAGFDELADRFAQQHPGVEVKPLSYDGSSTLATQIIEGAPADVFAAADQATMASVVEAGLATAPADFATNRLTLVVPAGNPAGVTGLADLADPDLAIVLCAPAVPCGAAAATLLEAAGIEPSIDSSEQNVTAVLTKVAAGEADAGLVYVTDAATTDEVEVVETAGADAVVNRYPIVALGTGGDRAEHRAAAEAFVAYVLSDEGRSVLVEFGFGAP